MATSTKAKRILNSYFYIKVHRKPLKFQVSWSWVWLFLLCLVTHPIKCKYTHCVDHSNGCKCYEAHQEPEGVSIQPEVHGFRVENGPHQISFGCIETWEDKLRSLHGEVISKSSLKKKKIEGFEIECKWLMKEGQDLSFYSVWANIQNIGKKDCLKQDFFNISKQRQILLCNHMLVGFLRGMPNKLKQCITAESRWGYWLWTLINSFRVRCTRGLEFRLWKPLSHVAIREIMKGKANWSVDRPVCSTTAFTTPLSSPLVCMTSVPQKRTCFL